MESGRRLGDGLGEAEIRRLFAGAVVTMLLACAAVALTPAAPAHAAGSTYYVDCSAATNGTGTSSSPWNSPAGPNATTFAPGDQLLFKRGTTGTGLLHPLGSGSAVGGSITMSAYGTGALPVIAGGGGTDAIYLCNQEYWEISDLEVTNTGAVTGANERRGVYVVLENYGTGHHYKISNLNIHGVNGTESKAGDGSAGIQFSVIGTTTTPTTFDDLVIDGNTVSNIHRSGINMSSVWGCRPSIGCSSTNRTPFTNVVVQNNTVHDTSGDGIVVQNSQGAVMQHNVVYNAAQGNTANAGIWAWDSDNTVIQYNEAYGTQKNSGNSDGQTVRDAHALPLSMSFHATQQRGH